MSEKNEHSDSDPLSNEMSAELAKQFMENSNRLISEALASCEIQGFNPVPLDIPQAIQDQNFSESRPPEVHAFFKQAESVWQNLVSVMPLDNLPVVDNETDNPPAQHEET